MLDIMIYKGARFAELKLLDYRPYIQPIARHVPLSHHNAHAPSVHAFWPIGEISRMWRLSFHQSDFEFYRDLKCERFETFRLDPVVLSACRNWNPRSSSTIASSLSSCDNRKVLRIILPYHSMMQRKLSSVISGIEETWNLLLQGVCSPLCVRASYRNFGVPLMVLLQKCCSKDG